MPFSWRQWLRKTWITLAGAKRPKQAFQRRRITPWLEALENRLTPVAPKVLSIARSSPGPLTNATSVSYAVTFDQSVTGVPPADSHGTLSGGAQAAPPAVVSGSGSAYTVTVNGIHGEGDL